VLINQFTQIVEVYRCTGEERSTWHYTLYEPDATIELSSIDVYLMMAEIYRGIDFDEPLMEE